MSSRRKELTRYIIPTMMNNVSFFLLTIVDGMFVGHGVGTNALGAVNLAMPFIMILGALFTLTTMGGVAVASVRFGRGDDAGANKAFLHALSGTIAVGAIASIIGLFFTDPLAKLLGANDTYHTMVTDYVFWYSVFLIPSGCLSTLSFFCRNDGYPLRSSAAAITCTIANMIGDWLLVFPLGMGIKGAAIASGVAQSLGVCVLLPHYLCHEGKLRFSRFKPEWKLYQKVILRGTPEMISEFSMPLITLAMNLVLITYIGDVAVNTYSVIGYAASLFYAMCFGVSSGCQPLFGRSYGAKDDEGVRWFFRTGMTVSLLLSLGAYAVSFFASGAFCALFGADPATRAMTIQVMPVYSVNFVFAALNILISTYFYSTKRTTQAVILNTCRSFLFSLGSIALLPMLLGKNVVWLTVAVSEFLSLVLGLSLWKHSERNGIDYH